RTDTPFTSRCAEEQTLTIPVKHGEGAWYADDALYDELVSRRQIVLRYAEPVNGSRDDVAGVVNEHGNVLGLMTHPEHAVGPLLARTLRQRQLLECLRGAPRSRAGLRPGFCVCRHGRQPSAKRVTGQSQVRA